jgi:hypothetical protein
VNDRANDDEVLTTMMMLEVCTTTRSVDARARARAGVATVVQMTVQVTAAGLARSLASLARANNNLARAANRHAQNHLHLHHSRSSESQLTNRPSLKETIIPFQK